MSVIGSNILAGASGQGGGYNLTKSLRFRSSASAYLNRTPASAGNRRTWTYSAWIKRGSLTGGALLASTNNNILGFSFTNPDDLSLWDGNTSTMNVATTQVFRDPSAWYHIVVAFDTTQATASNRVKFYVNGVQVTSLSRTTYPTQNAEFNINNTTAQNIGRTAIPDNYFDGYITEVNFIDGQALTPSSFGETSATTGVWQPKRYAGTYGTNGFYLPFTDVATTSGSNAGLGKDFSGNGNYWNTNNISITSGATYDSMTDVPTLTSATASNFAVMNPLSKGTSISVSSANLNTSMASVAWNSAFGTMGVSSGKWYWESTLLTSSGADAGVGISSNPSGSANSYLGVDANSWAYYGNNGNKRNNDVGASYGATYTNGDVIGIALDLDAGTLTFYKNNTSQGTAYSSLPANTYFPAVTNNNSSFATNFGQRPFAYTPPTGFVALNTFNLPTPTIGATASTQANKYFDVVLNTGTGTTRFDPTNFAPAMAWTKSRSASGFNIIQDTVRGAGNRLITDGTQAELFDSTYGSFASNGFSYGSNSNVNSNGVTYANWYWAGNGTGVTNTAGSITSTVSANTTSGFSIVTYTGNASVASFGHGLGVAPKMIIIKNRSTSGSGSNWCVGIQIDGWNWATDYLYLNTTAAKATDGGTTQFYSAPTSTVVNIGGGTNTNGSGNSMVAYCFSEVAGYSKFTSYVGNGSSDGTFVYCGFKPRWIMVKRSSATSDWFMIDTARNTYNEATTSLFANASNADYTLTTGGFDVLSNGFKLRVGSGFNPNASGETYIVAAFSEHPFKYSLAR